MSYIERFSEKHSNQLKLNLAGRLNSFEDVYDNFITRFGRYRGDFLSRDDFIEGAKYSWHTLSIFCKSYDNRGGGIRPVGKVGTHEAVVVNVTLTQGQYQNSWIDEGRILKCSLKARNFDGSIKYNELSKENQSIANYPDVPIMVFVRSNAGESFTYYGIFRCGRIVREASGPKWFELIKCGGT